MNKDRVEGKVKDITGRMERQAGEWTGDEEKQAHGAMKQVEGKVQNAVGKAKDAIDDARKRVASEDDDVNENEETAEDVRESRRKAS
ncbi:MAG: CsbD family protein [Acidobacteriia bacterium]|nr:CsbD family protein [Terriglobia bacterium]